MIADDRAGAFTPATLSADLLELRRIFAEFFASLSDDDWNRRTERRGQGWYLWETVAHLDAVAGAYRHFVAVALGGGSAALPGLARRGDLLAWNDQQITARLDVPIAAICESFLASLDDAARLAATLGPAEFGRRTATPVHNDTLDVAELLAGQLSHAGIVHAAQVANGAQVDPLWARYSPELMHRQLCRFFNMMAHVYWPERGGELHATAAFSVEGDGGGDWHIVITPEGAEARAGEAENATIAMHFRSPDLLCRMFTLQIEPFAHILTGQIRAWGDPFLGSRLSSLFLPT